MRIPDDLAMDSIEGSRAREVAWRREAPRVAADAVKFVGGTPPAVLVAVGIYIALVVAVLFMARLRLLPPLGPGSPTGIIMAAASGTVFIAALFWYNSRQRGP